MRTLIVCTLLAVATMPVAAWAHGKQKHVKANLTKVENHFGRTGDPENVTRTIQVLASDKMKFQPQNITIKQGETIKFVIQNKGEVIHEMVIGSEKELIEHAELMERFPEMEHSEPFMAHVPEQSEGEMFWTFDKPGVFHFGCLIPGHFSNGMRGIIEVLPASDAISAEN